jgi:hypothetical protein
VKTERKLFRKQEGQQKKKCLFRVTLLVSYFLFGSLNSKASPWFSGKIKKFGAKKSF